MAVIKDCFFCGSTPKLKKVRNNFHMVYCPLCSLGEDNAYFSTKEAAIERWNYCNSKEEDDREANREFDFGILEL